MPDDSLSPDAAAPQAPQVPVAPPSAPSSAPNAPPAPDVSELSPDRRSPMPAPQVDPVKEHHAAIGHALSRIAASLEGKEISYVPDEQNPGQVRQVVQPRKAGGFWRDVLLGSIAGGAAGAESPNRESAIGGAALGARAGLSTLDASQEKRKQVAQQSAKEVRRSEQQPDQPEARLRLLELSLPSCRPPWLPDMRLCRGCSYSGPLPQSFLHPDLVQPGRHVLLYGAAKLGR
jgi:hypothetical protein